MALHDTFRPLIQRFLGLTRREQVLLLATVAALFLAVFFFIHLQVAAKAETIQRSTDNKLRSLNRIEQLTGNYHLGQKRREHFELQLDESPSGLISYVEQAASQANVEISSITPRPEASIDGDAILERSVQLTLTNVTLENLVAFLNACETGPGIVHVKQLVVQPRPQNVLTAQITVATYSKKK